MFISELCIISEAMFAQQQQQYNTLTLFPAGVFVYLPDHFLAKNTNYIHMVICWWDRKMDSTKLKRCNRLFEDSLPVLFCIWGALSKKESVLTAETITEQVLI